MRKLLIVLAVLFLVIAGALAFAVVNLNSYLNENKDLIAEQVEGAIGREVRFDEASVSLSGGLGVRLTKLSIADLSAGASAPGFQQKSWP